jgi:hypothetical protein
MLAVLGMLAYAASMMTHEALGHGGYCLVAGGHNAMLTAWWETCNFPGTAPLGIKAAGPGVQLGAGLLAWLLLHRVPASAATLRWFLWLYMVFDLFDATGYVVFSGLTRSGDAAELIAGLQPVVVWRVGLAVVGSVAYYLSMRASAFELKRLAGLDDNIGRPFRVVAIPYVSAGVFSLLMGAVTVLSQKAAPGFAVASPDLNRKLGQGAALGLAALSSFGAGAGVFGLPAMQPGMAKRGTPPAYVKWSAAWGVIAAAITALFLVFIGPGLR